MTTPVTLSPAAQAVLDAFYKKGHRFNFCPSCGSDRRSAIVVADELEGHGQA